MKPFNASVNAIFALGRVLNGAIVGFDAPFTVFNGSLNGSVPFYGPNFVLDGEVKG